MKKLLKWLGIAFGGLVLLVAAFALWHRKELAAIARNWDALTEGAEIAARLKTEEDVLDYVAAHPESVSLAAWTVGEEGEGIFLNADVPRPLASTVKILVLAAYADRVEAGTLDPGERIPVAIWERFWLPGTDGRAHDRAMEELRERERVADDGTVALDDVVRAMIRHSDNAATDLLLERFGPDALATFVERLDLPGQEPPFPIAGMILTWESARDPQPAPDRLARYAAMDRRAYVAQTWLLARALGEDEAFRAAERARLEAEGLVSTIREQAALTKALGNRGTARGYARLMERVATGELQGSAILRRHLEWPMEKERVRERFDVLGTKGGSLAGVLTSAYYARPKDVERQRVLALFFQDLPIAAWLGMSASAVQQRFEAKLLQDDAFFERVKARLAPAAAAHGSEAK
mgnify:CR=1 FL=1